MKNKEQRPKRCTLLNGRFSWILIVDGQEIAFDGSHSADYFASLYKKIGYEIVWAKEDDPE